MMSGAPVPSARVEAYVKPMAWGDRPENRLSSTMWFCRKLMFAVRTVRGEKLCVSVSPARCVLVK